MVTGPRIGVYLNPEPDSPQILSVVVENYGDDAAYDLAFEVLGSEAVIAQYGPLIFPNGIGFMVPGHQVRSVLGAGSSFADGATITVRVAYAAKNGAKTVSSVTETFTLDPREFANLHWVKNDPLMHQREIAEALDRLANSAGSQHDINMGLSAAIHDLSHQLRAMPSEVRDTPARRVGMLARLFGRS